MPSIIDTEPNRKAMPNADFSKWLKPEDLAKVVLFLCSEESYLRSSVNNFAKGADVCMNLYSIVLYLVKNEKAYFMTISGFALLPVIVLANTIDTIDISTAVRKIRLYD